MTRAPAGPPGIFVSADWSKDPKKRSVHVADLGNRRIQAISGRRWDLAALLDLAGGYTHRGPVLIGLDLALGLPSGYWSRAIRRPTWRGAGSFLDWLRRVDVASDFFHTVRAPDDWRVERPFFHVPAGKGSLGAFQSRVDGGLLRRVDRTSGAKPLFAVSGIPGTVGSGTRALWTELIPSLAGPRGFMVWPFEGSLEDLFRERAIVLAETYPSLAYSAALSERLPARRILIGKTREENRRRACERLGRAGWVRDAGADLGDLTKAVADEDAFDSLLTAAAVLRCAIEETPLCDPTWIDATAEGGMLLMGPVDPRQRARRFAPSRS